MSQTPFLMGGPARAVALAAFLLALFALGFSGSAQEGTRGLETEVGSAPWYPYLKEGQKDWLQARLEAGLGAELPRSFSFFSLEPELRLFATAALEDEVYRGPAVPHATEAGKDDWGALVESLTVHGREGDRLEVSYGEHRGWLARSAVRLDAVAVLRSDGSYSHDLLPGFQAGGSRAKLALRSNAEGPILVVRYVKTYRGDDEIWLAFALDEAGRAPVAVHPWEGSMEGNVVETTVEDLPAETAAAVGEALGLGSTGFIRHGDGQLQEAQRFFSSWDGSRGAVAAGGLILVDSSFYAATSPVQP